jgi:leader peptidase (prepilin peptidase)/N-methyltransferase
MTAIGLVPVTLHALDPWAPLHRAAFLYLASTALAHALLVAAFIDARHAYLPDAITLGGAVLGVSTSVLRGLDLREALTGACLGFFVTAIPFVYGPRIFGARPGLGLGDAKLMILAGAWLGSRGALVALGLGALQGLLAFGIAKAAGKKILVPEEARAEVGARPALPFGPFLVLGVLERMFAGTRLDALIGLRWPPW